MGDCGVLGWWSDEWRRVCDWIGHDEQMMSSPCIWEPTGVPDVCMACYTYALVAQQDSDYLWWISKMDGWFAVCSWIVVPMSSGLVHLSASRPWIVVCKYVLIIMDTAIIMEHPVDDQCDARNPHQLIMSHRIMNHGRFKDVHLPISNCFFGYI
jgi:hypothetical protein